MKEKRRKTRNRGRILSKLFESRVQIESRKVALFLSECRGERQDRSCSVSSLTNSRPETKFSKLDRGLGSASERRENRWKNDRVLGPKSCWKSTQLLDRDDQRVPKAPPSNSSESFTSPKLSIVDLLRQRSWILKEISFNLLGSVGTDAVGERSNVVNICGLSVWGHSSRQNSFHK